MKYFVKSGDRIYGPVEDYKIERKIASGFFAVNCLISTDREEWKVQTFTRKIESGDLHPVNQEALSDKLPLRNAPKIFKDFCFIPWNRDCQSIYNLIRGLSPYPAAHALLRSA